MTADSGELEIRAGQGARAAITLEGATLRQLLLGEVPLLDGFGPAEIPHAARGQVLAPWPNRIADGRYRWEGRELQLELSEPTRGHAIHGLVRWEAWEVVRCGDDEAELRHVVLPRPGYPFTVTVGAEYRITDSELTVSLRATNSGSELAPVGLGMHPYLAAGPEGADACELRVSGQSVLASDSRLIPTATVPVDAALDFREIQTLGSRVLDTCYTQLESEGETVNVLWRRPDGVAVTLWALAAECPYLMVYAPRPQPPGSPRPGIAVEPMTCAPDAFNNGLGLRVLEPGESLRLTWGIRRT